MKKILLCSVFAAAFGMFIACGDDSGSGSSQNGGVSEGIAKTVEDLAVCTEKIKDNFVFVSSEKADYVCDGKSWKLDEESSEKTKSSSSKKVSEDDDDPDEDLESDEEDSSSSTKKSSASTKRSSSSSKKLSSSSEESGEEDSSSSNGKVNSSSSSRPTGEVAKTLDDAIDCTEDNVGFRVYIQDEDAYYVCTAKGYEEDETRSSSSQGGSRSSSSKARSSSSIVSAKFESIVDERDGQSYDLVTIGDQIWMTTNLNYVSKNGKANNKEGSWCYDNLSANCDTLGRLYTWAAAMNLSEDYNLSLADPKSPVRGICPEGLYLPSSSDWQELYSFVGSVGSLNAYGFAVQLGGQYVQYPDEYNGVGFSQGPGASYPDAPYWTSTQFDGDEAVSWYIYPAYGYFKSANKYKVNAYGVRCVRNLQSLLTEIFGECSAKSGKDVYGMYNDDLYHCTGSYVEEGGSLAFLYSWTKTTTMERETYQEECVEGKVIQGEFTGAYYICSEGGDWREATVAEKDTYQEECNAKTEGKVFTGASGAEYICVESEWRNYVPVTGECSVSMQTIEKGESVQWNFTRTAGTKVYTYSWKFSDGRISTDEAPMLTYDKPGHYTASVVFNEGMDSETEAIECSGPLKVNGTPISDCECTNDAAGILFSAEGKPATATWTASGCTGGNTFTYTWGGDVTGSSASAGGSFEKEGSFAPTLTVSNEEEMEMVVTCPAVTVSQVPSASCYVGKDRYNLNSSSLSVMPGQSFSFMPKDISGFPSGVSSVSATLIGGGSETEISISKNDLENTATSVTAPDAFSDYTYTLSANGIDICDAKVTVAVPNVACYVGVVQNSVSSAEVSAMPGQKFYFKPDGSGNSYWDQNLTMYMDLKGEGVEASVSVKTNNNSATSYSAPSSLGKYEYKLSLNGETLCSAAINVEYPKITSTSCDLTEHSWDHTHYFTPGASFDNWDANVVGSSFDMTLYLDDEVVTTKSVSRIYNGDWAQITLPTAPGVHVYKLMFETNEVCSVEYEVEELEE